MITNAIVGVTGSGTISMINNVNKPRKQFFLACLDCSAEILTVVLIGLQAYTFTANRQNQCGLNRTMNMPIRQPGEIGPKPMMANTENTARHWNWALLIIVNQFVRQSRIAAFNQGS